MSKAIGRYRFLGGDRHRFIDRIWKLILLRCTSSWTTTFVPTWLSLLTVSSLMVHGRSSRSSSTWVFRRGLFSCNLRWVLTVLGPLPDDTTLLHLGVLLTTDMVLVLWKAQLQTSFSGMRLVLAADVLLALGACQTPNVRKPLPGVGALGSQACSMCGMGRLGGCSGFTNLTDDGKYILRGSVHGHA